MDFESKFNEIMNKRTNFGVLGKMDAILKLVKANYKKADIRRGLVRAAQNIKNQKARDIAIDVYLSRVR